MVRFLDWWVTESSSLLRSLLQRVWLCPSLLGTASPTGPGNRRTGQEWRLLQAGRAGDRYGGRSRLGGGTWQPRTSADGCQVPAGRTWCPALSCGRAGCSWRGEVFRPLPVNQPACSRGSFYKFAKFWWIKAPVSDAGCCKFAHLPNLP